MVVIIWAASSLIFFLPRLTGEDAIQQRFKSDEDRVSRMPADRRLAYEQFRDAFGFEKPVWRQYVVYIGKLARFNLGYSMSYYPVTVNKIVADSILWTIGLLGVAIVVAFAAGTVIGGLLGWQGTGAWVRLAGLLVFALAAVPYYLLGLILVFLFGFRLGWFPLFGGYSIGTFPEHSLKFAFDVIHHSILPALTVVLASTGFWALQMRGMVVTVMGEDFMTLAQSKGLTRTRLFFRYAVRNALLPQTTGLAISLGTVLTGVMLVEIVFNYPGLGYVLRLAIRRSDYFVITGLVYTVIVSLSAATFLMDVLYPKLDPRIRGRA